MIPPQTINQLLKENKHHDCTGEKFGGVCVKIVAIAGLPTRFGYFQIVAFQNNTDKKEHAALVKSDVIGKSNVTVRLHSECLTGDGFGSLRCDCRDQLTASLEKIEKEKEGIILYLRQEGRGIGFANKIKAYELQEKGYDTYKANKILGFKADERDYNIAAHMLSSLHITSIKLMTNNPDKIEDLKRHGITVNGRIPLIIRPNRYNRFYLETKKHKAGHLLELPKTEDKLEQYLS
ncbi:GTP cyclohydrolase II [Candidatus Gottesmanbacteria bacterium]|nr:GTP cyclohydrolase II [Candidatus Gottesmanbacteria bacterium]